MFKNVNTYSIIACSLIYIAVYNLMSVRSLERLMFDR